MTAYRLLRPALFRIDGGDPEAAHEWTLARLEQLSRRRRLTAALRRYYGGPGVGRTVFGVRFPSLVGLAAGADKDGRALRAWPALGFGFVEVGTVTWQPQPGNPKPRLFRLPASEAIVNRMGFNNHGAAALAARLAALGPLPTPLGISLGKSKVTPVGEAVADYVNSLRALYPYGDYFAINVSSPNTPGLRGLQDAARLGELLGALQAESRALAGERRATPLLVKIAPDLSDAAIGELLQVCADHAVAGLIAVNTTVERPGVAPADATAARESGGLSGRPVTLRAREVVRFVCSQTGGALPVIGVGGIWSADDALRMLDAGASLLQVYSGLIYRGPGLLRQINRAAAGVAARTEPRPRAAMSRDREPNSGELRRDE